MEYVYSDILSPLGSVGASTKVKAAARQAGAARRVIGLLDNSKPNAGYFLETVEEALRRGGDCEIVRVTKPRSAGPCPDLDKLVARCDAVVNAVAD